MEAEGAYATVMLFQAGSGRAAISTSMGTPASPGEFTTTSRLTPLRCAQHRDADLQGLAVHRLGLHHVPSASTTTARLW